MKLPRFFVGKNKTDTNREFLKVPPENVLSLRKKDDFKIEINFTHFKDFFSKHKKLVAPLGVLVLVLIIFSVAIKGKASIVNFYPETCLGGWENPSNTSGQPSVSSEAQGSDFTRDNSAFLKNRTAQMFCGDFGGEVPADTIPRKFTVRFSWFVDDGSYDKGEKIINEALDEGRNVQTQTTESEDTDSVNQGSDENLDDASGSQPDSSTDNENTDDSSVPSNEDGSSDLPSGEMPQEDGGDSESETPPSDSGTGGIEDSSGDSSESGSDASGSDAGGSESSGGESSSGGEGAFLKTFFTKAFAQENENPTQETAQESENVTEEAPAEQKVEESKETPPKETTEQQEGESPTESESTEAPSNENTESENEELESNGIVSLDETARDDLFRVMYTLDGTTWEELGIVKRNNWKNVEFDIPFSSVDSWEKLSKVQIAIESLPTIDSFPETYLDSVWVSVEYEGVNPDPLPQPDFLTDKVLNDIRYENTRVIKILKPDGEYQIWYAFVPPSLLSVVDGGTNTDEIVKSGDSSLQVIDASTLFGYDPLIGPSPQNTEANNIIENSETTPESTLESNEEVLGESVAIAEETKSTEEDVAVEKNVNEVQLEEKKDVTLVEEVIENKEIKPFENVLEFVTGGGDKENKKVDSESEKKSDEQNEGVVLNEEIIKEEGDSTDLRELNQPEWYWNLVARGKEVHPEYSIAVDNFKLFWITEAGDSINMFGLDSSGTYSGTYFTLNENVGSMSFQTPSGVTRFAQFNRETTQFIFSDE